MVEALKFEERDLNKYILNILVLGLVPSFYLTPLLFKPLKVHGFSKMVVVRGTNWSFFLVANNLIKKR